uniref:Uncharacterized protein n=1 Tax=Malurus cyaneus samueli TaxID=2593467 RepID=A0A8C5TSA6_9PASS
MMSVQAASEQQSHTKRPLCLSPPPLPQTGENKAPQAVAEMTSPEEHAGVAWGTMSSTVCAAQNNLLHKHQGREEIPRGAWGPWVSAIPVPISVPSLFPCESQPCSHVNPIPIPMSVPSLFPCQSYPCSHVSPIPVPISVPSLFPCQSHPCSHICAIPVPVSIPSLFPCPFPSRPVLHPVPMSVLSLFPCQSIPVPMSSHPCSHVIPFPVPMSVPSLFPCQSHPCSHVNPIPVPMSSIPVPMSVHPCSHVSPSLPWPAQPAQIPPDRCTQPSYTIPEQGTSSSSPSVPESLPRKKI